jgi:hypothetical protein
MSYMAGVETKALKLPATVTGAGVTGSFIDLQGLVGVGNRNLKAVLLVGAGTTVGTAGGTVQAADDTAGTNAATVATFSTQTTIGGVDEQHFYTNQRYVRFLGSVQATKDMILGCIVQGEARYRP